MLLESVSVEESAKTGIKGVAIRPRTVKIAAQQYSVRDKGLLTIVDRKSTISSRKKFKFVGP